MISAIGLSAQDAVRYRDQVFKTIKITRNISYGEDSMAKSGPNVMDIYVPADDTVRRRPVIILLHGGGFRFGSKKISRMRIWGNQFAGKGYVVVAMNYRLSKKKPLTRFPDLAEACADAMDDVTRAVEFLKHYHKELRIDPGKIILAGHSAGGMVALQSVYSSRPQINALLKKPVGTDQVPAANPEKIFAVINFWGAIYDTAWLTNTRVPIVSVHGSKDRIVPYNFRDAPIFGSGTIARVATRIGIINDLKTYRGKGHELQKHFNPVYAGPIARKRWRQAADFAAAFLYSRVLP